MQPTTLNEYYQSKGQTLPSISDRQGLAAQSGIQNYTGTAQQNTQLLATLLGNSSNNQVATPSTPIPAQVATGTTTPVNLPNRPQPQAQSNLYTQAASIIANLPKTGVAGLDQTNQALAQLPAYLYEQQGIGAKQTANSEAQTALKLFDEESRQKIERERTNPQLGAETLASRTYAIEKDRAFMAGTLAIKAAAASQDYETAMTVMKTMNEMISEPLRQNAQFFKEMYMKTEDQRFQRAMKASDQAFQREMKGLDQLSDLKMQAFKDGKIDATQLATIKTLADFAKVTGTTTSNITQQLEAKNKLESIDSLINGKGQASAVGATGITRKGLGKFFTFGGIQSGARKNFVATTESLLTGLTIQQLQQAKANGATFGALTEGEMKLLDSAASKINQTKVTDKNGKTVGYAISEKDFNAEMNKIKQFAVIDYERRTGQPYSTQQDPAGLGIDVTMLDPVGLFSN